MTVIVAQKTKDSVVLASDRQETWGRSKSYDVNKITRVSDDFAVLSSGSSAEASALSRYAKRNRPKAANEEDIYDYIWDFFDYFRKRDSEFQVTGHHIIYYMGRIFSIVGGHLVLEHEDYCALGSGMFAALAAFKLGRDAENAVGIAKEVDLYCGGETHIEEFKSNSYIYILKEEGNE